MFLYIITENTPAVQLQKILCVHIHVPVPKPTLDATAGSVTNQNLLYLDSVHFFKLGQLQLEFISPPHLIFLFCVTQPGLRNHMCPP